MIKLYAKKILYEELNIKTGDKWKIEDVPLKWRDKVKEYIAEVR